jgi:hypothetical protein
MQVSFARQRDLDLAPARGEPFAVSAVVQLTGTALATPGDTLRIAVRSMRDTAGRSLPTPRGATTVLVRDAGTVVSVPRTDAGRTEAAVLLGAHGFFGLET